MKYNECASWSKVTLKTAGVEVFVSSVWINISVVFAGSQTVWATVVVIVIVVVVLAPLPWQWYIGWRFRIHYSAEMTGLFQNSSFSFCFSWFYTCLSLSLSFCLSRSPSLFLSLALSLCLSLFFQADLEPCIVNYVGSERWSGGFHILVWY